MNSLFKASILGISLSLTAAMAIADEIIIDVGTDVTGGFDDGDTITDVYEGLGVNVMATSILHSGFDLGGGLFVPDPGVSTFTEAGVGDITSFLPVGGDNEGLNVTLGTLGYSLEFNYSGVTGYFDGAGVPTFDAYDGFNSNYIDLFFVRHSDSATEQVLRLLISGSSVHPLGAGVVIFGQVDYSFVPAADTTGADATTFFNLDTPYNGNSSFYDIWAASSSIFDNVRFRFDFNVDPQDAVIPYIGDSNNAVRSTMLDGSVTFNVPEPSIIAILGLGLLVSGIGGYRRRLH